MQKESMQSTAVKRVGTNKNDIIEVILEDHKPLKALLKIMKDLDKDFSERKFAFEEFAPTLSAHAKPEEEVLYAVMKNNDELREKGFEAEVEHGLADQLVEECQRTDDQDLLSARIKVLAELVEHHIKEEEEQLLPNFRKNSDVMNRAMLGEKFLKLKVDYLAAGDDNVISDPQTDEEEPDDQLPQNVMTNY